MRLFLLLAVIALIAPSVTQAQVNPQGAPSQSQSLPSIPPQENLATSRAWIGIRAVELNRAVAKRRTAEVVVLRNRQELALNVVVIHLQMVPEVNPKTPASKSRNWR